MQCGLKAPDHNSLLNYCIDLTVSLVAGTGSPEFNRIAALARWGDNIPSWSNVSGLGYAGTIHVTPQLGNPIAVVLLPNTLAEQ